MLIVRDEIEKKTHTSDRYIKDVPTCADPEGVW